jgi:hypothetical protein
MNDDHHPDIDSQKADEHNYVIRIRRRSFAEWMAWLLWFIMLVIILEYALASFSEHETQAGIVASMMVVGLLVAGLIVEIIRTVESRSQYQDLLDIDSDPSAIAQTGDSDDEDLVKQ